ncbi:unnamed protein product [Heligmosomoides polygyrus]|uniref:GCM domain-containing protein n=1 Tax=Heligmosomoides polygyrus TaxID=6339 RepID=A0A3P7XDT3_HELPZ|nr:unnamed protein product [Heligmosomoides polygyrus]
MRVVSFPVNTLWDGSHASHRTVEGSVLREKRQACGCAPAQTQAQCSCSPIASQQMSCSCQNQPAQAQPVQQQCPCAQQSQTLQYSTSQCQPACQQSCAQQCSSSSSSNCFTKMPRWAAEVTYTGHGPHPKRCHSEFHYIAPMPLYGLSYICIMSATSQVFVLEEGAIVVLPTGPHRIIKLASGTFCAVPLEVPKHVQEQVDSLNSKLLQRTGPAKKVKPSHEDGVDATLLLGSDQQPGPSGLLKVEPGLRTGEKHYFGIPEMSKYAQHSVLVYKIPGQQTCYTFMLQKTNRTHKTYRCIGCSRGSGPNKYTGIKVVRNIEFLTDPCALPHLCTPKKWIKEKSRRAFYEKCQDWRSDDRYANSKPSKEHTKLLSDVQDSPDLGKRNISRHRKRGQGTSSDSALAIQVEEDKPPTLSPEVDELDPEKPPELTPDCVNPVTLQRSPDSPLGDTDRAFILLSYCPGL